MAKQTIKDLSPNVGDRILLESDIEATVIAHDVKDPNGRPYLIGWEEGEILPQYVIDNPKDYMYLDGRTVDPRKIEGCKVDSKYHQIYQTGVDKLRRFGYTCLHYRSRSQKWDGMCWQALRHLQRLRGSQYAGWILPLLFMQTKTSVSPIKERKDSIMDQNIKEAQKFFQEVEKGAQKYSGVPDPGLQQKIKKVGESAGEVVKHIQERTNPQKG